MILVFRGSHIVVRSRDAEADRAFFRDILDYPLVDAGGGWLIFRLPPAGLAVHPAESAGAQELFLMCDDIGAFVARVTGVYQPAHSSPAQ